MIRSTDGESWSSIPGAPANVRMLGLDPHTPTTIYAGGPTGLFSISLGARTR